MWKAVIIDDEPYVIEGLKTMIHWEQYASASVARPLTEKRGLS